MIAQAKKFSNNGVNLGYLRGLIETDGSFQIHLSNKNVKPIVKITQKTNSNVLIIVKDFLKKNGIFSFIGSEKNQVDTSKGRAPSLLITGKDNVRTLLNLLEQSDDAFIFTGVKQRDFLIMKEIVNNTELNTAESLGLKKSLHKATQDDPDFEGSGRIARTVFEQRFNLNPGDSVKLSKKLLTQIDDAYKLHQARIETDIEKKTLIVSPAYIAGLVDGDGSYYVTFSFKEPGGRNTTRTIEWQGNFTITMEKNALLTVKVLLYAIDSTASIQKKPNAVQVLVRAKNEVGRLIEKHDEFPLIGNYRVQQLNMVKKLRELKDSQSLKTVKEVHNFLELVYSISAISTSGRPRLLTLEEAKAKAIEWLNHS